MESVIEWMLQSRYIFRESLYSNNSKSLELNSTSLAHKDDTARAFCDIHTTSEKMRRQMIEIASYCSPRITARQWIENMCFIVMDWFEGSEGFKEQINDNPKADEHRSFKPVNAFMGSKFTQLPGLKIENRESLADPSSYVAVSYCWNREQVEWYPDQGPLVISERNSLRRTKTPNDVLKRAIAYAAHENVNSIWIDQECINQDDPVDKERGIQAMDIVYQEASHPIAILETYFDTQAEVDSFCSIVHDDAYPFHPSQLQALESILDSLAADSWFTRAWTLQESTSAGVSMVLLIGCNVDLNKPDFLGATPGEIEISIWDFQNAMVIARLIIEEHLAAQTWPDDRIAIQASNSADELWNVFPFICPDSRVRDLSHRQSCAAAQALRFLDDRSNSLFPDRLSILANLCQYEYRIESRVLTLPQYSFTTCVMTLAILNGDMSLLGGYEGEDIVQRGQSRIDARHSRNVFQSHGTHHGTDSCLNFGFSWGPIPTGCLEEIRYREEFGDILRLKSSTLSDDGLRVSGILWRVDHPIAVPRTQNLFSAKWQQELEFQKGWNSDVTKFITRTRTLIREFLWVLLNELTAIGHVQLAKSIWHYVQPPGVDQDGFSSKSLEPPHPFDTVFSHFNETAKWKDSTQEFKSHTIIERIHVLDTILGLGPGSTEASLERIIVEQVCSTGKLMCGSLMDRAVAAAADHNGPAVLFENCLEGDLVFTPWTSLGNRVANSSYSTEALSWTVIDTERIAAGPCPVLHCLDRRRGYWDAEESMVRDYVLA